MNKDALYWFRKAEREMEKLESEVVNKQLCGCTVSLHPDKEKIARLVSETITNLIRLSRAAEELPDEKPD